MSRKLAASKIVRKSAAEIPAPTCADLDRLRAAMQSGIDTSEISERRKFERIERDASGKLPARKNKSRRKSNMAQSAK